MAAFVLDTSAIISVLRHEVDAESFRTYLDVELDPCLSLATLFETCSVLRRKDLQELVPELDRLLDLIEPELVPFDVEQFLMARSGYERFGRGSGHPAGLNFGDCFAYALAKTRGLPLLFKGDDFVHTDIVPALKPA
ncbi:MAG: type II toxin-antitoxin system VapC family toxin [Rhizobiaceae bacterium]|nr:type II toxin-antitoxin system VapC family toxin [Rhizobiaceae bacterium]